MKWTFLFVVFVAIHLNVWMWDETAIVWGFPVNLLYHLVWSLALAPVMWIASQLAPGFSEDASQDSSEGPSSR